MITVTKINNEYRIVVPEKDFYPQKQFGTISTILRLVWKIRFGTKRTFQKSESHTMSWHEFARQNGGPVDDTDWPV